MNAPKRDRPHLPKGYIKTDPQGMLTWTTVEGLLLKAPYFWIATTNNNMRPHLIQTWAVWIDQELWFEGSDQTRWARNLAREAGIAFGIGHNDRAASFKACASTGRRGTVLAPSRAAAIAVSVSCS